MLAVKEAGAPPLARVALVVCAPLALASAIVTSGCESAVSLEVRYESASSDDGGAGDGGAGTQDREGGADASASTEELTACPCDERAGLGCCLPHDGVPFCTSDDRACARARGALLRCFRGDPSTESVCCWHGAGAGATTALAASCDASTGTACLRASDCAVGPCSTITCDGIEIGRCGTSPPVCPLEGP